MLLSLVAGCIGAPGPVPQREPLNARTFGVVFVVRDRIAFDLPGDRLDRAEVGARFVRFSGLDRAALESYLGLPPSSAVREGEVCAPTPLPIGGATDLRVGALRPSIELLDVGDIEMRALDRSLRLLPRSFPDLADVLSGTIYGGDESLGLTLIPGADYQIAARGAGEIASFDVSASAPELLGGLMVAGEDPLSTTPTIARGADLAALVRWEAGDAHDDVLIQIDWMQFGTRLALVCRGRDEGALRVSPAVLGRLPDPVLASDARMSVYRIRRKAFAVAGLDEASLLFVASESFAVRIE